MKKILRPISAPITSMICALVTFCMPVTSMLSLDSTRKRQERSPYSYKAAAAIAATHRIASGKKSPTSGDWQFFLEANCGGRRHAFARAGREIPRLHPDPPDARHRVPRAQVRRWVGTTPPARWCRWISAPSVQVSCRQGIAELFQYSLISRIEIDKKLEDLHRQGTALGTRSRAAAPAVLPEAILMGGLRLSRFRKRGSVYAPQTMAARGGAGNRR